MPDQFNPDPLLLPGKSPADPTQAAGFLGGQAANFLGIPDAVKALQGQMTPEEGQNFFMSQVPSLFGPEAKAGSSLAALGLLPRIFKEGEHIPDSMLTWGTGRSDIHTFDLINELNTPVARTWIKHPYFDDPTRAHIEMIRALDPSGSSIYGPSAPQSIGLKELRTVIPEFKKYFPEVKQVEGYRISGAREKALEEAQAAGKRVKFMGPAVVPIK